MRVLVTGADGFVGQVLVRHLLRAGDAVAAACRPGGPRVDWQRRAPPGARVEPLPLEITRGESVAAAMAWRPEAVVHLAAVSSVRQARHDPGGAWEVNAAGTARLVAAAAALREAGQADPVVLVVSTGEVYGAPLGDPGPRAERAPLLPQSPYAASKVGAEVAALEAWRRAGLRVIVARPFPHTGCGQSTEFVVPAFVERLTAARTSGAESVPVGNLEPVRDLLDVRDVVAAYRALLWRGVAGEVYNVARGDGISLRQVFAMLADMIGTTAMPRSDPALLRSADILHLVGDSSKLRRATGWAPTRTIEQTLGGVVDAEAD